MTSAVSTVNEHNSFGMLQAFVLIVGDCSQEPTVTPAVTGGVLHALHPIVWWTNGDTMSP